MGFFLFWLIMAVVVAIVATNKGRPGFLWFLYGFVVWPVALVHALVIPRSQEAEELRLRGEGRVKCTYCAEFIRPEARTCPFCRRELHAAEDGLYEEVAPTPESGVTPPAEVERPKPNLSGDEYPQAFEEDQKPRYRRNRNTSRIFGIGVFFAIAVVALLVVLGNKSDLRHEDTEPVTRIANTESSAADERSLEEEPESLVSNPSLVREIQSRLKELGYDPGPVDGVLGPKTRKTVGEFQSRNGMQATGRITLRFVESLESDVLFNRFRRAVIAMPALQEDQIQRSRGSSSNREDADDALATFIILDGHGCPEVADVVPLGGDKYEVTCRATAKYPGSYNNGTYIVSFATGSITVSRIR
jgi:hypothetical protein